MLNLSSIGDKRYSRLAFGQGPALALLLAGPALSLPSIAVIYSIFGLKKTATFIGLVVLMSALAGLMFGTWTGSPA